MGREVTTNGDVLKLPKAAEKWHFYYNQQLLSTAVLQRQAGQDQHRGEPGGTDTHLQRGGPGSESSRIDASTDNLGYPGPCNL